MTDPTTRAGDAMHDDDAVDTAALMRTTPFSQMAATHVEQFIAAARRVRYATGQVLLDPGSGEVQHLYCVVHGSVTGRSGMAETAGPFEYGAGTLFPIGAVLGQRAVTATYSANEPTLCLLLPASEVQSLAARSAPFADFVNLRAMQFVELSRRAVRQAWSSQALAEQSLEARLKTLPRKDPLTCPPHTPLAEALAAMHERRVGSVVVASADGAPLGILTRHDILGRVTLPQRPLSTPIAEVMSTPILSLSTEQTMQDAALLMSRHAVRHLPLTEAGRIVSIVSERDLFALQRQSLKQVSTRIRAAHDLPTFRSAAMDIGALAHHLLGQGVHARQMTQLISHLNDLLAESLLAWQAERHGLDMQRACWLAFGSEGRSEQTISTDQDNGLIFASDDPHRDRPQWLALARDVNDALDACGYPLCKGNVMASNPQCCLTADEWVQRFTHWIEHGAPEDLLKASIYFDFRALAGQTVLAQPLVDAVRGGIAPPPRFMRQLAENALRQRVPLSWLGAIDARQHDGHRVIDLKMQGTAIFVDAARVFALAQGLSGTGTSERLEAAAPVLKVPAAESQAWITGFEFLQMLRLRVQLQRRGQAGGDAAVLNAADGHANLLYLDHLNELERRLLRDTLRVARGLQQRLELDYLR